MDQGELSKLMKLHLEVILRLVRKMIEFGWSSNSLRILAFISTFTIIEYAAAFASGYLIFNSRDPVFGAELLEHAIDAYEFALNFRGIYSESVPDAAEFYK